MTPILVGLTGPNQHYVINITKVRYLQVEDSVIRVAYDDGHTATLDFASDDCSKEDSAKGAKEAFDQMTTASVNLIAGIWNK